MNNVNPVMVATIVNNLVFFGDKAIKSNANVKKVSMGAPDGYRKGTPETRAEIDLRMRCQGWELSYNPPSLTMIRLTDDRTEEAIKARLNDRPTSSQPYLPTPDELLAVSARSESSDQWDPSRGPKMSNVVGKTIFKYQMPIMESFIMRLPAGAQTIRVAAEDGKFWLWAIIDTRAPLRDRKFWAVKTGGAIPEEAAGCSIKGKPNSRYVGCCAIHIQAELMLYIFEDVR